MSRWPGGIGADLPTVLHHRVLDAIPPASGAIVMASGIVSIDLDSGDHKILTAITL